LELALGKRHEAVVAPAKRSSTGLLSTVRRVRIYEDVHNIVILRLQNALTTGQPFNLPDWVLS
jgi:hypothetical protein